MIKICGILRYLCGIFFTDIPQRKRLLEKVLERLRYVAVYFLYPRVRSTVSDAYSTCVYKSSRPKHTAIYRKNAFHPSKRFQDKDLPLRYIAGFGPKIYRKYTANIPQRFTPALEAN